MIIECPNCSKKFNLNEKLIPKNGRTLKCSSCNHIWHYNVSLNIENNSKKILEDTEEHIDWIESQQHLIENAGLKNYLQEQILEIKKD